MTMKEWMEAVAEGGIVEVERVRGALIVSNLKTGRVLYTIKTGK